VEVVPGPLSAHQPSFGLGPADVWARELPTHPWHLAANLIRCPSYSQVERLLKNRENIFPDYSEEGFERAFEPHWTIEKRQPTGDSQRTLYLMRRRGG
jgi:hypothetical protein